MIRRIAVVLVACLVSGCEGAPEDPLPPPSPRRPPAPVPSLGAPPRTGDCFGRDARVAGYPGLIPLPATAALQGPDEYAAPYAPRGAPRRRIEGRGFAYEVSSPADLVAGFYAVCLETYATETEWRQLRTEGENVLFRIPLQSRVDPVVVLIADDPEGGPTVVVTFVEYDIVAEPRPAPDPTEEEATPAPSPTG